MDIFMADAARRLGEGDVLVRVDALMDWSAFSPILGRGLGRSGSGPQGYEPLVFSNACAWANGMGYLIRS